jgi:hypothetical protein
MSHPYSESALIGQPAIALFAALGWQTADGFDETFGSCGTFMPKSARLGNACGAIVVTKHGCANFMPTYDEVMELCGIGEGCEDSHTSLQLYRVDRP